jgi:cell division protein FtsI (penicillin-binding protein 3)
MTPRRPSKNRPGALLFIMLAGLAVITARLILLQVHDQPELSAMGLEQRIRTSELPAPRGEILDRAGTPLALNVEARDVYANPGLVTDPGSEAVTIARILGLDRAAVLEQLTQDSPFVYLQRGVEEARAVRLEEQALAGIGFLDVPKRSYPDQDLAGQLLGFVDIDGKGIAGFEQQYDDVLTGTPGERTTEVSAEGLPIATGLATLREPVPGRDIVTTIDRQMQYRVQALLRRAVEENGAKGGTVVVMSPQGEVYAMATYPWFDPNDPTTCATDPDRCRNRAVTDTFEPGSVNKIITAAAAIETGAVDLHEVFQVPSSMQVGPFTINDSHEHAVEAMTLGDIISESSNIGAALVANRVGSEALDQYLRSFGFGQRTEIGFPGEAAGVLPDAWDEVIRATASYGQGVSVTPLQIADVYATVANGGMWVRPKIVEGYAASDGSVEPAEAGPTRRVIDQDTAALLTRMLAYVVEDGTGTEAQIPGYQVAGKTGTARKLDEHGVYVERYMASFAGFLPAGDPRVVISVSLDEPQTVYGGAAAAPLFQGIATYAIGRLGIPPAPPVELPPHVMPLP